LKRGLSRENEEREGKMKNRAKLKEKVGDRE
jgi:hypothetical protein